MSALGPQIEFPHDGFGLSFDGFGRLDQLYVASRDNSLHDFRKERIVRTSQNDPIGSRIEHRTELFPYNLFRFRALLPVFLDQFDESLSDLSKDSDPIGVTL